MQGDREAALKAFSHERGPDARAIVKVSHTADQGFLFFVLPIILDSFFHKAAPWLFGPTTMRMMQKPNLRPSYVQFKKRLDRVLQVAIIGALVSALAYVAARLSHAVFRKLTSGA